MFRPKVNEISVFPQEVHQLLGSCESFTRRLLRLAARCLRFIFWRFQCCCLLGAVGKAWHLPRVLA